MSCYFRLSADSAWQRGTKPQHWDWKADGVKSWMMAVGGGWPSGGYGPVLWTRCHWQGDLSMAHWNIPTGCYADFLTSWLTHSVGTTSCWEPEFFFFSFKISYSTGAAFCESTNDSIKIHINTGLCFITAAARRPTSSTKWLCTGRPQ